MKSALENILVLDFATAIAGAYVSALLGDMGAEVIKIEPKTGDFARQWPPFLNGESQLFIGWNRNKKSLALDLSQPKGQEIALKLAAKADVVVQNFRPGVADRLGIGYNRISEVNPRLIYCSVSAFGQEGPYCDRPGFDPLLQAMGGVMATQGAAPGSIGDPIFLVVAVSDYGAALLATYGVMTALYVREKTGKGQKLETSLLNAVIALQSERFLKTSVKPEGLGSVVPYQLFKAKDNWLFLGVAHDRFWQNFCQMLGDPDLANDPKFITNPKRVEHKEELIERLKKIFPQKKAEEWLEMLRKAGVPCAPVQSIDKFMDDPQVAFNDMLVDFEHPTIGKMTVMGAPVKLYDLPSQPSRPAPVLGQHTREVLSAFGYSQTDIEGLEKGGIVYSRLFE